MWIISDKGFFSAVQKNGTSFLTIRARVKSHIDRLAADLSAEVVEGEGTDYPYRIGVRHEAFAGWLEREVLAISYDNFKSHLAKVGMRGLEHLCHAVWGIFYDAERKYKNSKLKDARKEAA